MLVVNIMKVIALLILTFSVSFLIASCMTRRKVWLGKLYGILFVFITISDMKYFRIGVDRIISTQKEKNKLAKDIYFTLLEIPNGHICRVKITDEHIILTKE